MKEDRPWTTLSRRLLFDGLPWLRLWADDVQLPDGRVIPDFYRLEMPDYATAIALTDDQQIVVLRQFKYGVGAVGLYLPAGYVEPGEDPLDTARRELREETGYAAEGWTALGGYVTDSNRGSGRGHFFLAKNARKAGERNTDDLEHPEIGLMTLDELIDASDTEVNTLGAAAAIGLAVIELRGRRASTGD